MALPTHAAADTCAGWLAALDSFRVEFLVLDAGQDRELLEATRAHPAWRVDYDDGESVLLVRSGRTVEAGPGSSER